ncbi:MAG: aminotransferase class I/II-fold pyridoxal phosphate-dependent enzyme [Spirochaetales bacterium]|nr:aminotransferase class I/II-fold pyridoxal phosphate-dependent enzyme [Spirochaetales bacterium]
MFRPRPFALERFFAKHEFSARRLLCSSDCESMSVRELLALEPGSEEALLSLRLGYTETRGAPALREALAKGYEGIGADGIFVHAGAEEALLNLFAATLSDGDRVVVAAPCYQSLSELPRALGATVLEWAWRIEGGRWILDPDELPDLARGARMIVLNLPHNPTGGTVPPDAFARVVETARREGAILLVDEVYRGLELRGTHRLPAVCEAYEKGVSLGVLSKNAGLAGLRIGWLASRDRELLDAVAAFKDYNSICSSGPSEALALVAIRRYGALQDRARALCERNLDAFEAFAARHPDFVEWTPPAGGSIAFPRLASAARSRYGDAGALAELLVSETGILLLPGALYEADASRFRLGFGRADFAEGVEELEGWLGAIIPARGGAR